MPHHAYKIKSEVFSVLRAKLLQSCLTLFETLWTVVCQASLSMGFSRQEYWSGFPCPPPGDLSASGIESNSQSSSDDKSKRTCFTVSFFPVPLLRISYLKSYFTISLYYSWLFKFFSFCLKKFLLGNQRRDEERTLPTSQPAPLAFHLGPQSLSFILWLSNHNMLYFFN